MAYTVYGGRFPEMFNRVLLAEQLMETGDTDGFDAMLALHNETVSRLSGIYLDEKTKEMMSHCSDLVRSYKPCGAGGGFLQVFVRENVSEKLLRKRISAFVADDNIFS